MKPITPNLITDWKNSVQVTRSLENDIIERIDYVIKTWFEVFGAKVKYWYFEGAGEDEVGDLFGYLKDDYIYGLFVETNTFPNNMFIIDKYGNDYGWESEIKLRWLFEEDFKEEIKQGKALYKKREQERLKLQNNPTKVKKTRDSVLIKSAKKKLSPEEFAALKRLK